MATKTERAENGAIVMRAFLKFKASELNGLPQEFKAAFRECGNEAYVIKRISALKEVEYEVRFLKCGYNVVAMGNDIRLVKAEFLQKAREAKLGEASEPFNLAEFIESCKQVITAAGRVVPIIKTVVDEEATAKLYAGYEEVKPFTGVIS